MKPQTNISRRTAVKGIGGLAAFSVGGYALSGSVGATAEANISANEVTISNDTGDVSELYIKPDLTVGWAGFDETIKRIRVLIEAKPRSVSSGGGAGNDGYWPVYRETPYLTNDDYYPERNNEPGTSGTFNGYLFSRMSELTSLADADFKGDLAIPDELPRTVLFSDDYSRPDYTGDYDERYLTGVSIDGGGNYLNGSYGVAGDTASFDEDSDGETNETAVDLRFTVSLHTAEGLTELAMGGAGEDYDVTTYDGVTNAPDANTYTELRTLAEQGHPAVIVEETSFDVTAENIVASTDTTDGNANTGGS